MAGKGKNTRQTESDRLLLHTWDRFEPSKKTKLIVANETALYLLIVTGFHYYLVIDCEKELNADDT